MKRLCLILMICAAPFAVWAGERPSLFRSVVVADSPLGVRVVSIDEQSQAFLADLRPEDLIVRVDGTDVQSIDEFAAVSMALKGKSIAVSVVVYRNGSPLTLALHLYSYPILNAWGIEFVPDYEFRFVEANVGRDYWFRLGRGFEGAGKRSEALDAYLNGLHNMPSDYELGLRCALLLSQAGQDQLRENRFAEGLASLRNSILLTQKLFDYSLTDDQLLSIKEQLQATIQAIRAAKAAGFKRSPENYPVGKAR